MSESGPAIFTADQSGKGQILALNDNGGRNSATARAAKGSPITFFVTGVGNTTPPGVDGAISGQTILTPVLPVTVTIGGEAVDSIGLRSLPGLAPGVLAVQVRVPAGSASGDAVPVVLRVGTVTNNQTATVAIQ